MNVHQRVELVQAALDECRVESAAIATEYNALLERTRKLEARAQRLHVETDQLLREYGLDPDNLPVLPSDE